MKPGDVQVYSCHTDTSRKSEDLTIQTTTNAVFPDAIVNIDSIDDTVQVATFGSSIEPFPGRYYRIGLTINKRGMITFVKKNGWCEYVPSFIPERDSLFLRSYDKNSSGKFDSLLVRVTRRFDTTVFGTQVRAFTLSSIKERKSWIVADTFGVIFATKGYKNGDTIRLQSAVINGKKYNRDTRKWNYLPLCEGDMYQYKYTQQDPRMERIETLNVSRDTVIGGVTYKRLSFLYPDPLRATPRGLYWHSGSKDSLFLPADASLGTQAGLFFILDTGMVYYRDKNRRFIRMDLLLDHYGEQYTWLDGIGILKSNLWSYYSGYKKDTLMYARVCGEEFGKPLSVRDLNPSRRSLITLWQNAPNPFSASREMTTIQFSLSPLLNEGTHTSEGIRCNLSVFDFLGRRVATLIDGILGIGVHKTLFNARGLAPGVYFYRLTTPHSSLTRRMVVTK